MAIPESQRVDIEEGVVFGTGGVRELRCDVYTPPAATKNGAAVVIVHGGGWRQGDRSQLRGYGILLGRRGYTCVAPEYRLTPEAPWPAQIEDVKAAIRWTRANAGRLGFDPDKIAIEGNSAGAHLALHAAATPNDPRFEGNGGNGGVSTEVAATVGVYAPTDMRHRAYADVGRELFGDAPDDAVVAAASPITYARADFPPALLIHGTGDEIVPVSESFRMYEALVEAGAVAELHTYAEQPHAFDAAPAFGRQCAEIIALFLDRYVAKPEAFRDVAALAAARSAG